MRSFLTHRLPYAPNRGDRIRSYHLLRELQSFADVTLVSFVHSAHEAAHAADLEKWVSRVHVIRPPRLRNWSRAIACLPTAVPLTHALLAAPGMHEILTNKVNVHPPDVLLAFCSGMARFALEQPLAGRPLVVDMVDVDSIKWRALADRSGPPRRWIYAPARRLGAFESLASNAAYSTVVVNERERTALLQQAPDARVDVIGNGVDVESLENPREPVSSKTVVFCGVLSYRPTRKACCGSPSRSGLLCAGRCRMCDCR